MHFFLMTNVSATLHTTIDNAVATAAPVTEKYGISNTFNMALDTTDMTKHHKLSRS